MNIQNDIINNSFDFKELSGHTSKVIKEKAAIKISICHNLSLQQVFVHALKLNIYPYRYVRNKKTISNDEQIKLAESTVAVCGTGGIGGYVILSLARLGIGKIIAIDGDTFDETNLNRQTASTIKNLKKSKVDEIQKKVSIINPSVNMSIHHIEINENNAKLILVNPDVIVDALDNIKDRFLLQDIAQKLDIPMIHGAVSGFEGQIMTILPGDAGLKLIYGNLRSKTKSSINSEHIMGVPAITPMAVGSFQTMEVLKILLSRGRLIRNRMLYLDLEYGQINDLVF